MAGHQELELKAVVDDPALLRERLRTGGATVVTAGLMEDRRYDRGGILAAGDLVLRTRRIIHDDRGIEMILGWKGPARLSSGGYKLREELEYHIEGGASPDPLLVALGYAVVYRIDRRIEIWELAGATLRIEWYPQMDVLLEVEGAPDAIEAAIACSGIPRPRFTADSLADFTARYERRTGQKAVIESSPG
jgi:adenylate cyclase class IV